MSWKEFTLVPAVLSLLVVAGCGGEEPVEEGPIEEEAVAAAEPAPVGEAGVGFAEWDVDRDTRLAANEFGTWIRDRGIFTRWAGDDPGIDARELGEGALGVWDTDNDMRLTEAEWTEGVGGWFEANDYGVFGDWDLNDDNFVDANELGEGFNRTGLFGDWDLNDNNLLEENEFGAGAFGVWDVNDDTFVDQTEWGGEINDWGV